MNLIFSELQASLSNYQALRRGSVDAVPQKTETPRPNRDEHVYGHTPVGRDPRRVHRALSDRSRHRRDSDATHALGRFQSGQH